MQKYFLKLNRIAAWLLFVVMAIYFITGYGMTKGLIDASWSSKMHLSTLPVVSLVLFVVHSWYSMMLALKRWRWWNGVVAVVLAVFYIVFLSFFVYVDRYYQPSTNKSAETEQSSLADTSIDDVSTSSVDSTQSTTSSVSTAASSESTVSSSATEKTFTLAQLSQYNGQNGQSAYVAVDGVVYDMTSVFRNGYHYGYEAGQDLTKAFDSKHPDSILNRYTVVGKLVN